LQQVTQRVLRRASCDLMYVKASAHHVGANDRDLAGIPGRNGFRSMRALGPEIKSGILHLLKSEPAAGSREHLGWCRKVAVLALVVGGTVGLVGALTLLRHDDIWTSAKAQPAITTQVASPVHAPLTAIVAVRWERYTNTRYGVVIDYPADLFAIQPPPPDNAGREFIAAAAGARFYIYSHANALDASVEELQTEDVLDIGDANAARQAGPGWYQVIAVKEADTILRRVLLTDNGAMIHRLEIAYPTAAAAAFAPVVERMTRSFRVDPSIPEKAARNARP
jgi:hypothetical protein